MRRAAGSILLILLTTCACLPDTGAAPGTGDASAAPEAMTRPADVSSQRCLSFGCAPGECLCDGRCTDLRADRAHCGACNVACTADGFCAEGACVDCRAMGAMRCGDSCVDVRSDPANCGACGRRCADDRRCDGGVCVPICAWNEERCDGRCLDVRGDPANCGACGVRCPPGLTCVGATCSGCAQAERRACGDVCVDTRTDRANCGACGVACGVGAPCVAGACVPCGGACTTAERCVDGACVPCGAGLTVCGDRCVDLAGAMEHCGACGRACAPDERCAAGACVGCPGATRRCGEACVDVSSSQDDCGACGNRCDAMQRCFAGRCADRCEAASPETCEAGTRCVDGFCTGALTFLRAPLSTSITTGPRPWLRWRLPRGADGAEVEVCTSRRCDRTVARWEAAGESLRAPTALTPGVYFWRAVGRRGRAAVTAPSVVWEFIVRAPPAPDAYVPPPTGLPLMNDLNADGLADEVTSRCVDREGCGVLVHYGAVPGATPLPDQILSAPSPPTTSDGWTSIYRLQDPTPLGDVDGDGFGDLAVNVFETSIHGVAVRGQYESVRVYVGGAAGLNPTFSRFGNRSYGTEGLGSMGVTPIGDRNGDGMGDLLWAAAGTPSGLEYTEYAGPPPLMPFGVAAAGGTISLPSHIDVGDFDADGAADVVVAPSTTSSRVEVWLGRGGGTGFYSCRVSLYFWGGQRWVIRDTNDDGFDDLDLTWNSERTLQLGSRRGLPGYTCPSP